MTITSAPPVLKDLVEGYPDALPPKMAAAHSWTAPVSINVILCDRWERVLQIKDLTGTIIGYVHRTTGEFLSPSQMDERRRQKGAGLVGARA